MDPEYPNSDGRVARRERTQRAIVEAHIALLREGDLRPTGERIAARAGVSTRTFWLNYKDMDALLGAVAERVFRSMQHERSAIDPSLPLPARLDAYCAERARLLELLAPLARASAMRSEQSAVLREYERKHVRRFAEEIEAVFGNELPPTEPGRSATLHALTAVTTWGAWSQSRDLLELDVEAATGVLRRTFSAVLTARA